MICLKKSSKTPKQLKNGNYLVALLDMKNLKASLFKSLEQNPRQIYVLAGDENRLIASINHNEEVFQNSIKQLPKNLQKDATVIFGDIKNQPLAYHKKTKPNIFTHSIQTI